MISDSHTDDASKFKGLIFPRLKLVSATEKSHLSMSLVVILSVTLSRKVGAGKPVFEATWDFGIEI